MGETERFLKARFFQHQRKSNVSSEVSQHVHVDRPEHGVHLDKVKILTVENKKFERDMKEVIHIWVAKPRLNKDGFHYLLPAV